MGKAGRSRHGVISAHQLDGRLVFIFPDEIKCWLERTLIENKKEIKYTQIVVGERKNIKVVETAEEILGSLAEAYKEDVE